MKKLVLAFILCLCINNIALAVVFGPTNLDFLGYQEHSCYQPSPLYNVDDEFSIDLFYSEFGLYKKCIQDYIDAADNDIERIIEERDRAVDEFNSFVNLLN